MLSDVDLIAFDVVDIRVELAEVDEHRFPFGIVQDNVVGEVVKDKDQLAPAGDFGDELLVVGADHLGVLHVKVGFAGRDQHLPVLVVVSGVGAEVFRNVLGEIADAGVGGDAD